MTVEVRSGRAMPAKDHLVENLEALEVELTADDIGDLDGRNERSSSLGKLP